LRPDSSRHRVKVSLIAPGLVAAGGALSSPVGQQHPERLLRPADVAAAVRFVVGFGDHGCPTEIRLQPHLVE
jgi:NADP-dependent 3-hydroxy acid dehydrogenase YdfG